MYYTHYHLTTNHSSDQTKGKKNSMKRPALNPCRLWLLFSLSLFLFWAIMICKKKKLLTKECRPAFDYHLFTQMDDNDTAFQFQLNNILPNALNTLRFSVQYSYSDVHLRSYSLAIVNG